MMHAPPDFLPIPKCFSHLVNTANATDGEPRSPYYLNFHHHENYGVDSQCLMYPHSAFSSKTGGLSKIDSVDEDTDCSEPTSPDQESPSYLDKETKALKSESEEIMAGKLAQQSAPKFSHYENDSSETKSPFLKLNSSLHTLQKEMKDLRCLDISLFCQLLSLHDAIQDFKLSISDRYSETGSEYSLGTASYMGSMSSLNDESDWGEDSTSHYQPDGLDASDIGDDASQSASSLLKQITDLALRAEEDF